MYDMLKVIFGAIVVGDFLLAIALFALWKLFKALPSTDVNTSTD